MSDWQLNESQLTRLSRALEDSYFAYERIRHIDRDTLPSAHAIHSLTRKLFTVVFPGYFGRQDLTTENVGDYIQEQLQSISHQIYEQVYPCVLGIQDELKVSASQYAGEVTEKFLAGLPEIREMLASDILSSFRGDPAAKNTDEVIVCYPATLAIGTYRLAHKLWQLGVPLMPRIMTEHAHSLTGIDIHPGTRIGRGFFIDHGTGVVIGETTIIGDNCKLYQGVTLGALSFPHDERGQIIRGQKRHPTLEDDVIVYSNASILGNVTIGKGATIGGNLFLTKSVPPGCTVSGKQAELKFKNFTDPKGRGQVKEYNI
ncbi:MAG: serine acetyltransferase [Planctomycetes bacterium]|nr:serine acetyltransferase [Planctomycetota bacterium]